MNSSTASLGGVPLTGAAPVEWRLTYGTTPYKTTVVTDRQYGEEIMRRARQGALALEINGTEYQVFATQTTSARGPNTVGIVIQDRRWAWERVHVERSYNLRKQLPSNRIAGGDRIENIVLTPDVAYHPWSLDNGVPWTLGRILQDLAVELDTDIVVENLDRRVEIQDLVISDNGQRAMDRVLQHLGGYSIYIDEIGRAILEDMHNGREIAIVEAAGPMKIGGGDVKVTDRAVDRPSKIRVYFERRIEMRFDYHESPTAGSRTTDSRTDREEKNREPRLLENVLPSPDPNLTLADGRVVHQGTWITLQEAFDAWADYSNNGAQPVGATPFGDFDFSEARRLYLRPWDIKSLWTKTANVETDPVWAQRMKAFESHYRRTFRVVRPWWDRMQRAFDYRLSQVDFETGARAQAQVWTDYSEIPSELGVFARVKTNGDRVGDPIRGYADNIAEGRVAPVDFNVVDAQNGIIRAYLIGGPFGLSEQVVPGIPVSLGRFDVTSTVRNAKERMKSGTPLESDWSLATVFSVQQGAPNNNGKLHMIEISPRQAADALGIKGVGPAVGPSWDIKIEPTPTTVAQIGWLDAEAEAIESLFYTGKEKSTDPEPLSDEIFLNREDLEEVAKAAASVVYGVLLDRVEGGATYDYRPGLRPGGSVTAISHVLDQTGRLSTRVLAPPVLKGQSIWSLMDSSTRKRIQMIAEQ